MEGEMMENHDLKAQEAEEMPEVEGDEEAEEEI